MSAAPSAGIAPLIPRNMAREAFAEAQLLFVGYRNCKRRFTVDQIKKGIGADDLLMKALERSTYKAESGDYRNPPIDGIIALCALLGPDFTNEWLKLAGQCAFKMPEAENVTLINVAVEAVQAAAELNTAAAQPDTADLRELGNRLMACGANLQAIATRGQPELFECEAAE